jgi:hypothetical protein
MPVEEAMVIPWYLLRTSTLFFSIVLPTYSSKRDPWAYGSDLNIQLAVEGLK